MWIFLKMEEYIKWKPWWNLLTQLRQFHKQNKKKQKTKKPTPQWSKSDKRLIYYMLFIKQQYVLLSEKKQKINSFTELVRI